MTGFELKEDDFGISKDDLRMSQEDQSIQIQVEVKYDGQDNPDYKDLDESIILDTSAPTKLMVEDRVSLKVPDLGNHSTSTPCKEGAVGDRPGSTTQPNSRLTLSLVRQANTFARPSASKISEVHGWCPRAGMDEQPGARTLSSPGGCNDDR